MKKNILITGSNGFIGKSICEGIDKNIYDVYALGFEEGCSDIDGVKEYITKDIRKPFQLDYHFDAIVHLAALNRTNINNEYTYEQFKEVNVIGTKNVAKSCSYEKFILFSSANIYKKEGKKIDENSPVETGSYYEQTKYEAELICQELIESEKLVIVRPVNISGIHQSNKAMIPHFFNKAIKNQPIEVFVPQNRRIQLLSIRDLISAIAKIIQKDVHGILNLSSSDCMEVRVVAKKIINLCHAQSTLNCTNGAMEDFSEVVSTKAKDLLGWDPEYLIDEIINEYANHILSR